MNDQTAKKRENKVLRRNEYYAIQDVFDGLYAKSKQGAIFTDLMSLITSPQNIALAYRRIKRNKGSRTPGTNMGTIEQIAERGNDILVDYVQRRLANYKPHPVRRVMIPKDNGKERPLGIPSRYAKLSFTNIAMASVQTAIRTMQSAGFGFWHLQ